MIVSSEFQTPMIVGRHMATMLVPGFTLEPTPGLGNLVRCAEEVGCWCYEPDGDFFKDPILNPPRVVRFDNVIMNPPYSDSQQGWTFLEPCLDLSCNIVILAPWILLINSGKRIDRLIKFGMQSVTHLPRKTFPGSRVQTCVIHLNKHHHGPTEFNYFNF